jgi:hypothetical protein
MTLALLTAMDREKRQLNDVSDVSVGELRRLSFSVSATNNIQKRLLTSFSASAAIDEVHTYRSQEDE